MNSGRRILGDGLSSIREGVVAARSYAQDGDPLAGISSFESAQAALKERTGRRVQRYSKSDGDIDQVFKEIVSAAKQLAEQVPDNIGLLERCGKILSGAGASVSACRIFERVVRLSPGSAVAQYNYGIALQPNGTPLAALSAFERALRRRPGWSAAHNYRALCLRELDRPWEAREALDTAVHHDPDNAAAVFNRALVSSYLGDMQAGWRDHEARWRAPFLKNSWLQT